jgi:hypothetical protein
VKPDRRIAAELCWLLAPGYPGWRSALLYVRILRAKANDLVKNLWPVGVICDLAGELEQRRELGQDEIAGILNRGTRAA